MEGGKGVDLDKAADSMDNLDNVDILGAIFSENSRREFHKRLRDVVIDMVRLEYI